uniref:Uncharacterized protein n=1 Tax=Oryza meridionalis TaxID=40149 RepID=A0A0E0F0R7_9ORYZ
MATTTVPRSSSRSGKSAVCDSFTMKIVDSGDKSPGLQTWKDPTPRPSVFDTNDLQEAFVAASERMSQCKLPSCGELIRRRDNHDRMSLQIALNTYAKKTNIKSADLELVEVKGRCLIDEYGKGFLHFNFSCERPTGKQCVELWHPARGDYLGGHLDVSLPFMVIEGEDEDESVPNGEDEDRSDDISVGPTAANSQVLEVLRLMESKEQTEECGGTKISPCSGYGGDVAVSRKVALDTNIFIGWLPQDLQKE